MSFILLNGIFALIFLLFAWRAVRRGSIFLRVGWGAVSAHADKPNVEENVESRRVISAGSSYLIAGGLWCLAGGVGVFFGLWFIAQTVSFIINPL